MTTWERLADLPLVVDGYTLSEQARRISPEFERVTHTIALRGDGEAGLGEDVTYDADEQRAHAADGPGLPLTGSFTLASFSARLGECDLFGGRKPWLSAFLDYRRWAYESAALDLALRQAGRSLADVLERDPRPVRFVASPRLGTPPDGGVIARRLERYPGIEFKLDADPSWDADLLATLAGTGAVAVIDLKGAYRGTPVDVDTDPELYARVAAALPGAWLEDPDLTVPEADEALRPYRDRITWDAPIHSVQDVLALPFAPRTLNVKPSRFGSLERLFDFYDHCEANGIGLYGGGQSELGVGRGQIQVLAALLHPDGSNDIAPAGYDWLEFPPGLDPSPLDPALEPTGFRRRGPAPD
jgi:hypothetical protein